jgi:hypothetical protein
MEDRAYPALVVSILTLLAGAGVADLQPRVVERVDGSR